MRKILISVIGARDVNSKVEQLAHNIGKIVANMECILVCGGLNGVMMASAKGAKSAGGMTLGILPGREKKDANPYIDIIIPTAIGFARNAIVACSADIILALPGSHGTRSEICYGLIYNKPVIDLGNWNIEGMIKVKNLADVKKKIREFIEKIKDIQGEKPKLGS